MQLKNFELKKEAAIIAIAVLAGALQTAVFLFNPQLAVQIGIDIPTHFMMGGAVFAVLLLFSSFFKLKKENTVLVGLTFFLLVLWEVYENSTGAMIVPETSWNSIQDIIMGTLGMYVLYFLKIPVPGHVPTPARTRTRAEKPL